MIWLWWITVPTSCKVSYNALTLSVGQCMWKELESNSGPLSRSYGLEMIGFPILYWGVLHDESSLYSKSTPIKQGLFIPLWDTPGMFAWNKHFHPLSLFTSNTVALAGISIMCVCVCCGVVYPCELPRALWGLFRACGFSIYLHICVQCWHVHVHSHVIQCLLCSPALFVSVAPCL